MTRSTLGGNAFDSNGQPFNWVDPIKFAQQYNLTFETFENGASVVTKRIRDISGASPYYFYLNVPEGRELVLFSRALKLSQGDFDIDVVRTDGTVTGGEDMIVSPLRNESTSVITTSFKAGVTVTGNITVDEEGWADSGTSIGSTRSLGSAGTEGVLKGFTGGSLLRVTKQDDTTSFVALLRLIVWERNL